MENSCSNLECLPVPLVLVWRLLWKTTEKKDGYRCKYNAMHYLNKLWVGKEYLFLFCVHECDLTPLDISLRFHFSHLFIYFFAVRKVCLNLTDNYVFPFWVLSNAGWRWTGANWHVDIWDSLVDNYRTAARTSNISDLLSVVFVQLDFLHHLYFIRAITLYRN